MRALTTTWLVVLSAALIPASAWQITAYDAYACDADDDTQYRIISGGDGGSGCLNFGQDMPGTSCTKFTNGGWDKGPCDGQAFKPRSILVQPDTLCQYWSYEGCDQAANLIVPEDGEPTCGTGIWEIKSVACGPAS